MYQLTGSENAQGQADETLMARYAAGDSEAFDELFHRYEGRAYAFFLRRTRSPERAEDLYQELFLRIHRARDRYDAARPFSPWFFQIAHRLLVDDHRRAFRSQEVPIGERDVRSDQLDSDEVLADREWLGEILGALSPAELDLVLSAKLDGVGYPELARRLGKSVAAIKKGVSRTIQHAREARDRAAEAPAS